MIDDRTSQLTTQSARVVGASEGEAAVVRTVIGHDLVASGVVGLYEDHVISTAEEGGSGWVCTGDD